MCFICYILCNCNYITLQRIFAKWSESKFPDDYSGVIFIQIDQHLKKLLQLYNLSLNFKDKLLFPPLVIAISDLNPGPGTRVLAGGYQVML